MNGFIIQSLADESPARDAGLQVGDIIIKFGDIEASGVKVIANEVTIPEDGLEVTYLRNSKESILKVTGPRFGMVAEKYQASNKKTGAAPKEDKTFILNIDVPADIIEYPLKTSYGAGRSLASLSLFLGWIIIALGVVLLSVSLVQGSMPVMIMPSIIMVLAGWFSVQQSQLVLAITDTADSQREATNMLYTMLLEERNRKHR